MAVDQFASIVNHGLLAEFSLGLWIMQILLFCSSIFMMLLVLVQRGKGGGLTGALGGMGGQSAFGSKAGDAFTKITVITAVIWLMLCMVTIAAFNPPPAAKTAVDSSSISAEDEANEGEDAAEDAKAEGAAGINQALSEDEAKAAEDAIATGAETPKGVTDSENENTEESKETPPSGDGN